MTSRRIASAMSVVALVSGCTNLQAVNTAAGQLATAASSWNSVANEFQASCARSNQVSDVVSDCSEEKQATTTLEAANKILSDYFTALQQTSNSTGSSFSVDSGISALSSSVKPFPGVDATKLSAVTNLATYLADAATKGLQERTIDSLISDGAPKAIAAIDILSTNVVRELQRILNNEKINTSATFVSYISQSQSSGADKVRNMDCTLGFSSHDFDSGIAYLLAQAYCSRIVALSTKLSALDDYKKSLDTAKTALMSLESGKDNLGAKDIAQQLISEASSLNDDIATINKAF